MKTAIKLILYIVYLMVSSIKLQKPRFTRNDATDKCVALVSSKGIHNSLTAGDASILEFYNIFKEVLSQNDSYNLTVLEYSKYREVNIDTLLVRDLTSFVLTDLIRIFYKQNQAVIYYATDIFSNRIPSYKFIILKKLLAIQLPS